MQTRTAKAETPTSPLLRLKSACHCPRWEGRLLQMLMLRPWWRENSLFRLSDVFPLTWCSLHHAEAGKVNAASIFPRRTEQEVASSFFDVSGGLRFHICPQRGGGDFAEGPSLWRRCFSFLFESENWRFQWRSGPNSTFCSPRPVCGHNNVIYAYSTVSEIQGVNKGSKMVGISCSRDLFVRETIWCSHWYYLLESLTRFPGFGSHYTYFFHWS